MGGLVGRFGRFAGRFFQAVMLAFCGAVALVLACSLSACSGGGDEEPTLTDEQQEAIAAAAVEWCQEKYGIEATPYGDNMYHNGIGFPAHDPGEGQPVEVRVTSDERPLGFVVSVVDGTGTSDDYQVEEINAAIEARFMEETRLPEPADVTLSIEPSMYAEYFDGTNLDELYAEVESMDLRTLYFEEPSIDASLLPDELMYASVVVGSTEDAWSQNQYGTYELNWAYQPECLLPYLSSVTTLTRGGASGDVSEARWSAAEDGVLYFGTPEVDALLEAQPGEAGKKLDERNNPTGETFGDVYYVSDDAPTVADSDAVCVFVSQEEWNVLTQGYSEVGYQLFQENPRGYRSHGGWVEPSTTIYNTFEQHGDYYVLVAPPGARVTLYGTPVG